MVEAFLHHLRAQDIVCLEHQGKHLYAEVIQVVENRLKCWVRPFLLVVLPKAVSALDEAPVLYDLRDDTDLLWPLCLFRPVLDTELMPLLPYLQADKPCLSTQILSSLTGGLSARQQLRQFIRQVWQAYPQAFIENGNRLVSGNQPGKLL